jgi:hypothetical protein
MVGGILCRWRVTSVFDHDTNPTIREGEGSIAVFLPVYHICNLHGQDVSFDVNGFLLYAQRNRKAVSTSSHVQMFSSITILQLMVHRYCVSWADRNVCRPIVGQCTGVWHSNTLLQSFVSQKYDPEPDSDTRAHTHASMHAYIQTPIHT